MESDLGDLASFKRIATNMVNSEVISFTSLCKRWINF